MSNLKSSIEILRKKLHFLILYKELTDDEVVICSQELDKLLVKYEKNKFKVRDKASSLWVRVCVDKTKILHRKEK